jgi:beta-galactosidase
VQFFFPMWSNPQLPLKPRVTKDYPDNCITIQLPARQGKVLAVGYKGGKEVKRDSLINHGPVAHVRLDADYTVLAPMAADMTPAASLLRSNPSTVSHIRLTLVDKEGRIQQMQPRKFRVETEGPIRLLGVETGDMRRMDSWRTTELPTYFGEGLIRLQSTTEKGTAKVTFHVEGFDEPFVKEIVIER